MRKANIFSRRNTMVQTWHMRDCNKFLGILMCSCFLYWGIGYNTTVLQWAQGTGSSSVPSHILSMQWVQGTGSSSVPRSSHCFSISILAWHWHVVGARDWIIISPIPHSQYRHWHWHWHVASGRKGLDHHQSRPTFSASALVLACMQWAQGTGSSSVPRSSHSASALALCSSLQSLCLPISSHMHWCCFSVVALFFWKFQETTPHDIYTRIQVVVLKCPNRLGDFLFLPLTCIVFLLLN